MSPNNTLSQIEVMAQQLIGASKQLDELIQHLPEITTNEDEQLQAIVSLQQQNDEVGDELRDMQRRTETQLARVQAVFGVLADNALLKHTSVTKA